MIAQFLSSPEAMAEGILLVRKMAQSYIKANHPLNYGHVSSQPMIPAGKITRYIS